jgi:hypothetical protein
MFLILGLTLFAGLAAFAILRQVEATRRSHSIRPQVEGLEPRYAPAKTTTWTGGAGVGNTNWSAARNWNNGVPGAGDQVNIGGAAKTTDDLALNGPGNELAALYVSGGSTVALNRALDTQQLWVIGNSTINLGGNGLAVTGTARNISVFASGTTLTSDGNGKLFLDSSQLWLEPPISPPVPPGTWAAFKPADPPIIINDTTVEVAKGTVLAVYENVEMTNNAVIQDHGTMQISNSVLINREQSLSQINNYSSVVVQKGFFAPPAPIAPEISAIFNMSPTDGGAQVTVANGQFLYLAGGGFSTDGKFNVGREGAVIFTGVKTYNWNNGTLLVSSSPEGIVVDGPVQIAPGASIQATYVSLESSANLTSQGTFLGAARK